MKKIRKDFDKNVSPVGWYFGSYLQRFVELEDSRRNEPNQRFASWENSVVVKAKSISQAFDKVEKLAKKNSKPYLGGEHGVRVQWEYLGVTELIPIYEEIGDGAEIAWEQRRPRSLKTLRLWVKSKDEICA